jgi:hypothetical protein
VHEDVVADFGIGSAGEADLFDHAAEADATGTEKRIIAADIENFTGDSEAHGRGWGGLARTELC